MMSIVHTLRSPKVFGIALFDLGGTAAIAGAFSVIFDKSFGLTFAALMGVAIIVHYVLGVPTQLNFYLHLNDRVR